MPRTLSPAARIERSILSDFRKPLWRPFVRGIKQYKMIAPGDHIAVCISGGKDSMLLAKMMQWARPSPTRNSSTSHRRS